MTEIDDGSIINKVAKFGKLYDLYGSLLTARQREIVEMYFFDDWSLGEIAERLSISRQAVHDNLRRAESQLTGYDEALGLLRSQMELRSKLQSVLDEWDALKSLIPTSEQSQMQQKLDALSAEIAL